MLGSWTDWHLTDIGRAHADAIGINLTKQYPDNKFVLYASDLTHTRETAELIGKHTGSEPVFRTGLRDIHLGSATGKPAEWFELNKLPENSTTVKLDYRPLPDAESYRELLRRVSVVLDEILSSPDENVLVISHGKTLQMLFYLWVFGSTDGFGFVRFNSIPGGVSVLCIDNSRNKSILSINDMSYIHYRPNHLI